MVESEEEMKVRYKVDISRLLRNLERVGKVGQEGVKELTLEFAKRAASKAIRTTPPNSMKNGGNGRRALEEHIARDIGGDPLEAEVRPKRGEDGKAVPYAYPRKKRGGVLLGVRGKRLKGVATVSADAFLRQHTMLKLGRKSSVRVLKGGGLMSPGVAQAGDVRRALAERKRHVGRMAAGWLRGARLAGLKKVPAWIARHASHYDGAASLTVQGGRVRFEMYNSPEHPDRGQLDRVAAYAMDAASRDMRKVIKGYLSRLKKELNK